MSIFGTANLAQVVQSHSSSECVMNDIYDASAWKWAYSAEGVFGGDQRGISLALSTDGVNPFHRQHISYSMWPIVLTLLNLPSKIRNLYANLMMIEIVPGKGSKEDPYLEVVVDKILSLSNANLFDAYRQAPFQLKVEILLYIFDYQALAKVYHITGTGSYSGCCWCEIQGKILCMCM